MGKIVVSTDKMNPVDSYVCWLDIMGTQNSMSESFEKSANFILRFHAAVIKAKALKAKVYPVMDGVYITTESKDDMTSFLNRIMTCLAEIFLGETNDHRFVVRGAIAKGMIQHGGKLQSDVCPNVTSEKGYVDSLLFGMPMIQACSSETCAPPFGIYIHESARVVGGLQCKYYFWQCDAALSKKKTLQADLKAALDSFFEWEMSHQYYFGVPFAKLEEYKKRAEEYYRILLEG